MIMTTISRISLSAALAASALALAACPTDDPPPVVEPPPEDQCVVDLNFPTRTDPSTGLAVSLDTAEVLEPGVAATGTLCPALDDDGFRITAGAGDVMVVT